MQDHTMKQRRLFEIMLIVLILGMGVLYWKMGQYGLVVLNLFFLPVVMSGYFLGRTSAGLLAFFCALAVTAVTVMQNTAFAAYASPAIIGLALTVWAAALGMTALLMGTLCDERARTVTDLQRAYVGVVDVLSKYLQSANPRVKDRSTRIAELSQLVAADMRMPQKAIDDVRVAALLHDLGDVKITTQLINKAVSAIDRDAAAARKYTFLGAELVQSLGVVLESALPLVVNQDDAVRDCLAAPDDCRPEDVPLGARIISAVRAYDLLLHGDAGTPPLSPDEALRALREEAHAGWGEVLRALTRVVERTTRTRFVPTPEVDGAELAELAK